MKERFILFVWLSFIAIGIYMFALWNKIQQFDYNGWLLKNVYAAVAPDTSTSYKPDPEWSNEIENITVNIAKETVVPTPVRSVFVPPPPRHSH